jgi:2-hydroxychromene-2-carboxylate isomerase
LAKRGGWTLAFTRAVFAANYAEQKDISEDATRRDPHRTRHRCHGGFAAANAPQNKDALRRQTEEAASRGLFGAPSCTIGDELFWGNDRLEAALA